MSEEENTNVPVPANAWFWMKDSSGKPSASVTFATVSFYVTTVLYILAAFESLGPIKMRAFDVAACAAYFVPSLMLYFGRRFTELKLGK